MVAEPVKGEAMLAFPQILPGGEAVLFTSYDAALNADTASIRVMTLAVRHRKIVVQGGTSPGIWLPQMGPAIWSTPIRRHFAIPFGLPQLIQTTAQKKDICGVVINYENCWQMVHFVPFVTPFFLAFATTR
jgi:hypothetical protein